MTRAPSIEQQLSALSRLSATALSARYEQVVGSLPSSEIGRDLQVAAIGYRLQKILIAQLRQRIAQALSAGETLTMALALSTEQTILIKGWRNEHHLVSVSDEGVLYQGELYASLADVASEITGGKVADARFFESDASSRSSSRRHGR